MVVDVAIAVAVVLTKNVAMSVAVCKATVVTVILFGIPQGRG